MQLDRLRAWCRAALPSGLTATVWLAALPLAGQEPLWDDFRERLKSETASFGALLHLNGDFQADRTFPGGDGFAVAEFRFGVSGRLDGGVDYLLQSNFGDVLDARVGFQLHRALTIDAGRFKTPFSGEFLTGAGDLDFVTRSQSIRALAPNRALGVALRGPIAAGFSYSLGLFNGRGGSTGNPRGRFANVARLAWRADGIEIALNGAVNGDRVPLIELSDPAFATIRSLLGADLRVVRGPWLLSAEVDRGDGQLGTVRDPWGGFLTGGYQVRPGSQLLLRLDHLDTGRSLDRRTLVIGGWNFSPTGPTQIQINAIFPVNGFGEEPRLLMNLELML